MAAHGLAPRTRRARLRRLVPAILTTLLLLAVFASRNRGVQFLPELGVHHVGHVAVRDHRCIGRHVRQLCRGVGLPEGAHRQACVIGDESRAQADEQDRNRAEQEIAGMSRHLHGL